MNWKKEETTLSNLDVVYDSFVNTIKQVRDDNIPSKKIKVQSDGQYKRRRINKAWWSDELTTLWQAMSDAERKWRDAKGPHKCNLKAAYKVVHKETN